MRVFVLSERRVHRGIMVTSPVLQRTVPPFFFFWVPLYTGAPFPS
jgi:hypothetical protein